MPVELSQIDLICSDIDLCQVSQLLGNQDTLATLSSGLQIKDKGGIKMCSRHRRTVIIQVMSQA